MLPCSGGEDYTSLHKNTHPVGKLSREMTAIQTQAKYTQAVTISPEPWFFQRNTHAFHTALPEVNHHLLNSKDEDK